MLTEVHQCSLLVVDDAPTNRAIIAAHLRRAGFADVTVVEDGLQALAALIERTRDLVLLDILMPTFDGFRTCQSIRQNPRSSEIPVIAMTGLEEAEERARIFAAGANDLILKPVHSAELIARVTNHLQTRLLIRGLRELNERTSAELAAARQMQEALLPGPAMFAHIGEHYGVSLAAQFAPSAELAGDLWGVWPIDRARFGLFALDVMGHGTIAAINAFRIHMLLEQDTADRADPERLVEILNRRLRPLLPVGQFATMFYAVMDVDRNAIEYAAAGYTSPILRGAGQTRLLDGSGLPLGISDAADYETRLAAWNPGDTLLLYSDALTEAADESGALLGEDGAQRLLCEALPGSSAERIVEELSAAASADRGISDDLTLVCVTR